MTRYARSLVLSVCGLLIAASASAIPIPSRDQSSFPARGVYLVGSNGATVDAAGEFAVTVRGGDGQPMGPPLPVTVDFGACSPDIRLAPQTHPGVTMTGACYVTATINTLGVATFRIRGGALNPGNGPGAGYRCAVLSAAGVYLNNLSVATFDQAGNLDGVSGSDLAAWTSDFFAIPQPRIGRSDFNFDENLTGGDLAMLIGNFFSGGSAQNGGVLAGCP